MIICHNWWQKGRTNMIGAINFDNIDMALKRGEAFRAQIQKIGDDGLTFTIPQRGKYEQHNVTMKPHKWQLAKSDDMLTVYVENNGSMSKTQVLEIVRMRDGEVVDRIICKN